jgi:predicted RNase H-like nuclease (RuvC/YqgF family)
MQRELSDRVGNEEFLEEEKKELQSKLEQEVASLKKVVEEREKEFEVISNDNDGLYKKIEGLARESENLKSELENVQSKVKTVEKLSQEFENDNDRLLQETVRLEGVLKKSGECHAELLADYENAVSDLEGVRAQMAEMKPESEV